MNVACTACPAKYAVPDDRVRGKRVRITCKHCGTFIVVDGTNLGASGGSQAGPLPQGAGNNVRERRKTMLGIGASPNASAAASLGVPIGSSARASRAPQPEASPHHAWLVALADGRREPASLARIVDLFAARSIDANTYIWRDGMPDWKKPFDIPEIAAALRARGIGPDGVPRGLSVPPPDPDEATRVSFAPSDEAVGAATNGSRPPAAPAPTPGSSTRFDDESVTVARSGPPSNPLALSKPLTSPSGALPGQKRPTLPPLRPAAGRPSLPHPSTIAESTGRARQNTIPPLGAPAARPPLRSSTSNPPPPAPVVSSVPPPPPPPPLAAPSAPPVVAAPAMVAAPPAPSMPDAPALAAAAVAPPMSAPYVAPAQFPPPRAEFEVVPRSGPPIALDDDPFHPKRGKTTAVVVSLILVAAAAAAGFIFLRPRLAPPAPSVVAVAPPPPAPTPAPSPTPPPSETAEPAASASAAPSAVAQEKPSSSKSSASVAARATKRDESAPSKPSARKAAPTESTEGSTPTEASESSGSSEGSLAEKLAQTEEAPAAPKGNANDPEFNREAAAQGLGDAASRAESCRSLGGPSGSGQATVTFSPNGRVSSATIAGEFAGTTVGACISRLFRSVTVPAFSGESVTVSKRFTIE
ncbi:MAG: zinc-ribbon domain-containing protein [Myxococcota bacterium]